MMFLMVPLCGLEETWRWFKHFLKHVQIRISRLNAISAPSICPQRVPPNTYLGTHHADGWMGDAECGLPMQTEDGG